MLFTFNPDFRFDNDSTPKKKEKLSKLIDYLDHYEINKDRIIYIGDSMNKNRTYVQESPELLKLFFNHYKIKKNCVVLSDGGNSFFVGKKSVLIDLGFETHEIYPPAVHQYLSPNDNRLHGTSKASWRKNIKDFLDDVNASLYLMSCLDDDIAAYSKKWFDNNLINPSTDHVNRQIGVGNLENSKFRIKCMELYDKFIVEFNDNN